MSQQQNSPRRFGITVRVALLAAGVAAVALLASAQATVNVHITATTANASGDATEVEFELLRWSTDEERETLISAWTMPKAPVPQGGRGRGGGGFGGGGGNGEPAPPPSPAESLDTALGATPTLGYLWTPEVAGYAIRYAYRSDDGNRIILIAERRLGTSANVWAPPGAESALPYEFSLIELHPGDGEGKVSFDNAVIHESAASTLALENYGSASVVFDNVTVQ